MEKKNGPVALPGSKGKPPEQLSLQDPPQTESAGPAGPEDGKRQLKPAAAAESDAKALAELAAPVEEAEDLEESELSEGAEVRGFRCLRSWLCAVLRDLDFRQTQQSSGDGDDPSRFEASAYFSFSGQQA